MRSAACVRSGIQSEELCWVRSPLKQAIREPALERAAPLCCSASQGESNASLRELRAACEPPLLREELAAVEGVSCCLGAGVWREEGRGEGEGWW